jgi:hypothetical protein
VRLKSDGTLSVTDSKGQNLTSRFTQATLQTDGTYNGYTNYKKDSDGTYNISNSGSWTKSGTYKVIDQRENKYLSTLDIYVDKFMAAYPQLYSGTTYSVEQGRGLSLSDRGSPERRQRTPAGGAPAQRARCLRGRRGHLLRQRPARLRRGRLQHAVNKKPSLIAARRRDLPLQVLAGLAQSLRHQHPSGRQHLLQRSDHDRQFPHHPLRPVQRRAGKRTALPRTVGQLRDRHLPRLHHRPLVRGNRDRAWGGGNYYDPPRRDWAYDTTYINTPPPRL